MSIPEFLYTVILKPAPLRAIANAALRAIIPDRVTIHGATVCLNRNDPVVSGALTLGVYEREEIQFFLDHFQPGMTFVDVGANVGLYTALAIQRGAGRILALEPLPENFNLLKKTVAANNSQAPIHLEQAAAGREPGELSLYANPDNKGDNRLYPDPLLKEKLTVRVETLDDLCEKNQTPHIDFLKIDVQGAEMLVLEGAKSILAQSPSCIIMTEFWPQGLTNCGSSPLAYLKAFAELGFNLKELRNGKLHLISAEDLIATTPGRQYRNLMAFGPAAR
ncbi:MAG: FkbM family methyltransferase [Terrimicrobiaceae bacterium]